MTAALLVRLLKHYWPAMAAGLVMLCIVAWAYTFGVSVGTSRAAAQHLAQIAERDRLSAQAMAAALHQAKADAQEAMAAERAHLQAQAKTEARFRVITETVKEYIHANPDLAGCGLDADGLRVWNEANRGADDPAPGNP